MFQRARLMLTASYAAALALTLGGIGVASYVLIRDDLESEIDRSLRAAQEQLDSVDILPTPTAVPDPTPPGGDDREDHEDEEHHDDDDDAARLALLSSDVFYVAFAADGTVIANPRRVNLEGVDLARVAAEADGDELQRADGEHGHFRLAVSQLDDGSFLAVGRSLRLVEHQLETLRMVFLVGGVIGLVVSLGAGFGLAGRTLTPIRRALESQQQFVSDASHELRTPLTVARANNALLLDEPEATIESRLDQAEAVAAELDHLSVLVGDLTTLARADEGRANLLLEPLDLAALVDEVVRDMGALADVHGVSLVSEIAPARVRGDRARLRQLVVILVDNSLKYAAEHGTVRVALATDGRGAELSVTDDGPGIAPAEQKRIFERFYRVDSERTRSKGGTGLGLAIGKWITEAHGGRIAVESAPGRGTTFRVRLPLA
ncbi:MAG: ATP-binding protein [Dehalococcoidia bacterium]|nr:ATP-binding protein [Dehalococcoidia bacterium]